MKRPTHYPSERVHKYEPFPEMKPVLAWGFGRTPVFKHRTYALLAVAWGPLVQLVILVPDDEKATDGNDFRMDGHYFVFHGNSYDSFEGTGMIRDVRIEYMHFLSESILFVFLSNNDIRVLHTQSFAANSYTSPTQNMLQENYPNFEPIDSRQKLSDLSTMLTPKQMAIEMERGTFLSDQLIPSKFGGRATNTISVFQDFILMMSERGVFQTSHLTWREYVEQGENEMGNTWIETFKKALDIFHGKIKGFKGVVDDLDLRKEFLKAEFKILITNLIDKVILKWKKEAEEEEKSE